MADPARASGTASVERVRQALAARGLACEVHELSASTRTAQEAAAAVGCDVAQIVKSLVFRAGRSDRLVLALVAGTNRASEAKLEARLGEPVRRADAAFVRERTGFAIGGVPPLGHASPAVVLVDRDLLAFGSVWAAAGSPHAVFQVAPRDLVAAAGGEVLDLAEPA